MSHTESLPQRIKNSGPIAWMAQNSVAANLLMFVVLAGGVIGLVRTKQEVFPEFSLDMVMVSVPTLVRVRLKSNRESRSSLRRRCAVSTASSA